MKGKARKAIYAGSFDPLQNGHLWTIRQGSKLFDEVVVAIGENPDKKGMFSIDERIEMIRESTEDLPNVEVDSFEEEYQVDYAKSIGAKYSLRSMRNHEDFGYEKLIRNVNSVIDPDIESVFLMSPKDLEDVSSSLVRGLVGPIGWEKLVSNYVPTPVYRRFLEKFCKPPRRWTHLWKMIGAEGDPGEVYKQLVELYSQPERSYHNLVHINKCLEEFDRARHLAVEPRAIESAIWFHDAIYGEDESEKASAGLAHETLEKVNVGEYFRGKVFWLIMATKHHDMAELNPAISDNDDGKLMIDIDLSILGKSEYEFDEYERNIRKEYSHIDEERFRQGRGMILKEFLRRPSIYSTEHFRNLYENQARKNLERSIGKLENK
ncbi:pantetheine-phosphate adenylyltransferase [candidate division KSB1 bacterium]